MNLSAILPLARRCAALLRSAAWLLIAAAAFFSLLLLSLRYWVLPNIENYREDIASAISRASGQQVTVGEISANWDGLRPHMMLGAIHVYDKEGKISLLLHRLEGTVSWRSILYGGLYFREIRIDQPDLIVRRDTAGVIHLAGFALENEPGENENGFSNWLLQQKRVTIHNASIVWQDDLRAAPELELLVDLLLENQDNRHRFGIRATPSAELAAQLDMRGDFRGRSLDYPEQWGGQLFLRIDQANVALWQAWLPFPREIELRRGIGALRMWMGMEGLDIRKLTMDMRLSNVKARMAKNLPELTLSRVQGRVGWKRINNEGKEGFELSASRLNAFIRGKPRLQPLNFSLQMIPGQNGAASSGKLSADKLNLRTLGDLTEYLPMTDSLRNFLKQSSPHGEIDHVEVGWNGDLSSPSHFSAKGHFTNLGMKKWESLPAFGGMTGSIDITERKGVLNISSRQTSIELPDLFHEPLLLDTLTGQASWSIASGNDASEFRFSNISFSNPHAAGVSYGSYRTGRDGRGMVDIAGHLTRADVPWVMRYLPVRKDSSVKTWLEKSMVAGVITEARFRLKGNPDEFPFRQEDQGIFRLFINTSGATVDLTPEWPRIENISGNIRLHGDRVEFNGPQAAIIGTKLSKIKLRVRDIGEPGAALECEAEATGETRKFLELAARYGSGSLAGTLSNQISVAGNGRLHLKLGTPLTSARHSRRVNLAGSYQITGNEINPGENLPSLSDISGEIFFTESGISANNITARLLGGPMSLSSVDTRDGSVRMIALGKINLDNLYGSWQRDATRSPHAWTRYLRGSAEWRGMIHVRNKLANLSIESSLQGITSALPEPFSKAAPDRIPLRFERKAAAVNKDTLILSYGDIAAAKVRRTQDEAEEYQVDEGVVTFGAASVPTLEMPGISVSGTIRTLDLDQWRKIMIQGQAGGAAEAFSDITGVDLHLGNLTIFGRRLTDIELSAKKIDKIWHSTVASSEMTGDINWNPSGNGRILARLDKLVVPTALSTSSPSSSRPAPAVQARPQQKAAPALDVMVNDLILGNMRLGHLELKGAQHEQNWRIDKLRLSSPESSIVAKGIWHSRTATPRVQATITLESSNIGKFLTRLGHPDRVKRGTGKLEGEVSWDGSPLVIDYATMFGTFKLQAEHGQFPRFEPGIGRLFGFFDLRALPRRVMLDFRDVFSEGFAFDDISGDIRIAHGVAVTDDLQIEGPAANIILNGEVNLEAETQKLNFKVIPSLGLATPVVGLTEMIVNKALQSTPTPNEYDITGTWTKPIVVKKSEQAHEHETDEPGQQ